MAKFVLNATRSAYFVYLGKHGLLGIINQEGFHFVNRKFIEPLPLSTGDIRIILLKTEEVQDHGVDPPTCSRCQGTPYYPGEIYNPNEGAVTCCAPIHRKKIG